MMKYFLLMIALAAAGRASARFDLISETAVSINFDDMEMGELTGLSEVKGGHLLCFPCTVGKDTFPGIAFIDAQGEPWKPLVLNYSNMKQVVLQDAYLSEDSIIKVLGNDYAQARRRR